MKIGVITGSAASAMRAFASSSEVDAFEFRIDTFETRSLETLRRLQLACPKKVLFTLRSRGHGGGYSGDPNFLLKLAELHPDYLDVEYDIPADIIERIPAGIALICSFHDCNSTPQDLDSVLERMRTIDAAHYKLACMASSHADVFRLLELGRTYDEVTTIAMGELGAYSRIIAPIIGCELQYLHLGTAQAAGQLDAATLLSVYNYDRISPQTAIFALLGDPVRQSPSQSTHNAVFRTLDIDAVYVKIPMPSEQLGAFLDAARFFPFYGFSLTMPLKRHFSHEPVNTLKRACATDEGWRKKNTDGIGALNALEKCGSVRGKTVLILGAGGAAHAIALEARRRGAYVKIANRTEANARRVVAQTGGVAGGITRSFCAESDIIINATPRSEQSIIPPDWIAPYSIAMDISLQPSETAFLKSARKQSARCLYGVEMFIYQAIEQFVFWFPKRAHERAAIESIIRNHLKNENFLT